ncbi:LOW QUALITY PROTEIN: hypothetical protein PanWU01x14_331350 [Parasponia andersonii]|uniref:Uncharacterized protein n=1 Tax=Parasponia andersonii TaxID=3476 RepID=A0A2P5AHN4_PARAD|nr:LOW QUALITY PROTEIN: hypothetical protein PanWU01x14_331350 [Parasponia andersonii]
MYCSLEIHSLLNPLGLISTNTIGKPVFRLLPAPCLRIVHIQISKTLEEDNSVETRFRSFISQCSHTCGQCFYQQEACHTSGSHPLIGERVVNMIGIDIQPRRFIGTEKQKQPIAAIYNNFLRSRIKGISSVTCNTVR